MSNIEFYIALIAALIVTAMALAALQGSIELVRKFLRWRSRPKQLAFFFHQGKYAMNNAERLRYWKWNGGGRS